MIIETPQGSINLVAYGLFVKFVWIEIIILRQNNGCQIQVGKLQYVFIQQGFCNLLIIETMLIIKSILNDDIYEQCYSVLIYAYIK